MHREYPVLQRDPSFASTMELLAHAPRNRSSFLQGLLRRLVPAAVSLLLLLSIPAVAFGQWVQSDGQTFGGEKNYWGTLFNSTSTTLCTPLRVAQMIGLAAGAILFLWLLYKGGRGDYRSWKIAFVILVGLTILVDPAWWMELVGLEDLDLVRYWTKCGF